VVWLNNDVPARRVLPWRGSTEARRQQRHQPGHDPGLSRQAWSATLRLVLLILAIGLTTQATRPVAAKATPTRAGWNGCGDANTTL